MEPNLRAHPGKIEQPSHLLVTTFDPINVHENKIQSIPTKDEPNPRN